MLTSEQAKIIRAGGKRNGAGRKPALLLPPNSESPNPEQLTARRIFHEIDGEKKVKALIAQRKDLRLRWMVLSDLLDRGWGKPGTTNTTNVNADVKITVDL